MRMYNYLIIYFFTAIIISCGNQTISEKEVVLKSSENEVVSFEKGLTSEFEIQINETGRYRLTAFGKGNNEEIWVEDYIDNQDSRVYNISGSMKFNNALNSVAEGSPLQAGIHKMRIHVADGAQVDSLKFELIISFDETPRIITQNMKGENWELVWADEFNENGLQNDSNWSYNVGDWGWGNNELQYYTNSIAKNARVENGVLIIEAHQSTEGKGWTSARLTTKGNIAFKYGKIEFRAKVPVGLGTWAAGWLLGDNYRDEVSWPYCGEIDVLECVGFEIDENTEKGMNHGTCHTPAYYFKKNNQISSVIEMDSMNSKFHTYSVEWYPDVIHCFVDGERYYTYDKVANDLEWPFYQAQNIILNLAIGGGWGGAKGIDESTIKHQYIVDYVRVYQKK